MKALNDAIGDIYNMEDSLSGIKILIGKLNAGHLVYIKADDREYRPVDNEAAEKEIRAILEREKQSIEIKLAALRKKLNAVSELFEDEGSK